MTFILPSNLPMVNIGLFVILAELRSRRKICQTALVQLYFKTNEVSNKSNIFFFSYELNNMLSLSLKFKQIRFQVKHWWFIVHARTILFSLFTRFYYMCNLYTCIEIQSIILVSSKEVLHVFKTGWNLNPKFNSLQSSHNCQMCYKMSSSTSKSRMSSNTNT